ncbi:MAG TPA: prepilin-type N-terminal cleavage/methylation domain-containing protein [Acidimicrobiales bacterium]
MGARAGVPARGDAGLTIVELLVVLAVMAVVVAQATANFTALRERADDRRAQSNLRNGLAAARIYYNIDLAYTADPLLMRDVEPALGWMALPPGIGNDPKDVYLAVEDAGQTLLLGNRSTDGRCFWLRDAPDSLGYYAAFEVGGTCAPPAPADFVSSWG